jgi:glutamyl-tRNA synthetase
VSAAPYRGRFAPSPTGDLHLGSAATALIAWLRARTAGGTFVLRVEDIDTPRVIDGCEADQLGDLRWLGLDWDEGPDVGGARGPYRQSERGANYESALSALAARGATYLCDCSRRDIAGVASAPHTGEEGPRYPGTCRRFGMEPRPWKRPPAVRFAVPSGGIRVDDAFQGEWLQDPESEVGDFVLKRGDGIYAYQLAVVVDDLAMAIGEVVRGADLLVSAPRQALLAHMLGGSAPRFAHTPLVLAADGSRLEKRNPRQTLRGLRRAGIAPEVVVARLASALGLLRAGVDAIRPADLLASCDFASLRGRREVRL